MRRVARRLFPAAALLAAALATAVAVRTWLGERSFAEGAAARRRGDFAAAEDAYRAAIGRGNAGAAIERARLELARRDWAGAGESLRQAMALVPARGYPHVLLATLELSRPGPWDDARAERVLAACRRAVALEPARAATWSETAVILLRLASLRRVSGEQAQAASLAAEAVDASAEALARDPRSARDLHQRMLDAGGGPLFLLEAASRKPDPAGLEALVGLLLDRSLWSAAESDLWSAAEARGVLPVFAAAAADVLARRAMVREGLAAAQRGLRAVPGDGALAARAADLTARLPGQEALAAVPLYRAAVAAFPENRALRRRFAAFLSARGLFGEAEIEARAVLAADPGDAEAWFLLGEILRRSGRAGEAAAAYREAAGLRPQNAAYRRAAGG